METTAMVWASYFETSPFVTYLESKLNLCGIGRVLELELGHYRVHHRFSLVAAHFKI